LGIRTVYETLKKSGKVDTKSLGIFSVVFVGMVLMLTSWIRMCPLDPWRIDPPVAIRGIGLALLGVGVALAVAGIVQLRGLENIDHLITSGLFSKLRHPMYTGFMLWISGWVIYYGAVLSLLVAILSVGAILYWRRLEESSLETLYGDAYRDYRNATWF
jgi:protein-S-isoprenylcysteine O-methyltransferase Ste14